jgi:hypothetical protein
MKTIEVTAPTVAKNSDRVRPKVIKWHDVPMIRNHSFLAAIDEICEYSKEIDVVRVGIIGDMHSGKSTMAEAIGHAFHVKMHKKFKVPFAVRIFYQEDLLNFEETLKTLTPANYVLIFDDVSFLEGGASKSQISAVKQAVTKIRHLEGGADVKVVLIYNYHYNLGFDKYLRQADFRFFTSIGSSEVENMEKIVKTKNMHKVYTFMAMRRKAIIDKYWTVKLTPKEFFRYKWRDPFIPVLYYNNESLRQLVSPTREFMDAICATCAKAVGVRYSEVPVGDLCNEGETKFGKRVFESACRLKLFENGMAVHAKSVMVAKRWLDIQLSKRLVTLEQIMVNYDWKITKTRLRDQFSKIIDEQGLKLKDDTSDSKPIFE